MKTKKRTYKTIPEKYGISSVRKEVDEFISRFKKSGIDSLENFDLLPYLGILYVPYEQPFLELIYSGEDGELIKDGREFKKFKVIEVTEENWTISHWDDHHHNIVIWKKDHNKYLVEGNELILK